MTYQLLEHLGGCKHCAVYLLFAMLCLFLCHFCYIPAVKAAV